MKLVYPFFLPRMGGLMSDHFCEGMAAFGKEYGLPLVAERMHITVSRSKRKSLDDVAAFIKDTLHDDIPAAFLTLSTGSAEGLENWHWVLITAFDDETNLVKIVNNCLLSWTNVGTWLDTSIMGGAFVRLNV